MSVRSSIFKKKQFSYSSKQNYKIEFTFSNSAPFTLSIAVVARIRYLKYILSMRCIKSV